MSRRGWAAGGLAAVPLLAWLQSGFALQDPPDALQRRIKQIQDAYVAIERRRGLEPDPARLEGDACMRCHAGIDNPAYRVDESLLRLKESAVFLDPVVQGAPERLRLERVLRAHPRLELYVAPGSRHPAGRFACMDCHGGEERLNQRHPGPVFNPPMLATRFVQANCRACHGAEAVALEGAEKLALGMRLARLQGCFACHDTPEHATLDSRALKRPDGRPDPLFVERKLGPPLTHIADKVDRMWAYNFLRDPESFRLTTRMPRFFHRGSDDDSQRVLTDEQVPVVAAAIIEYLFQLSESREYKPPPDGGSRRSAARGRNLLEQIGCTACHRSDETYGRDFVQGRYDAVRNEFGPNLAGIGDKFDSPRGRTWLHYWLKDPGHYFADTRMPDMRLTDEEAADIVEYLLTLRIDVGRDLLSARLPEKVRPGPWNPQDPPLSIDAAGALTAGPETVRVLEQLVDEALARSLRWMTGLPELTHLPAAARAAAGNNKDRVLWLGRRMVAYWGCYSCHEMSDRSRGKSDWPRMEPTLGWYRAEDLYPVRERFERMGIGGPTSQDERDAVTTYLLSFRKAERPDALKRAPTDRERAITRGRRVLDAFNCGGCHELQAPALLVRRGGHGDVWRDGFVRASHDGTHVVQWLAGAGGPPPDEGELPASDLLDRRPGVGGSGIQALRRYKQRELGIQYEHPGHLQARMPPSLRAEGARVQPEWLRAYLRNPTEIRPLLRSRGVVPAPSRAFAETLDELRGDLTIDGMASTIEAATRAAQRLPEGPPRTAALELIATHHAIRFPTRAGRFAAAIQLLKDLRVATLVVEHNVRMPRFYLRDHEIDALVGYFHAQGPPGPDTLPPDPVTRLAELAPAMETIRSTCNRCHLPEPGGWAPDLRNVGRRLRPAWLESYLRDPLAWDAHSMMPEVRTRDAEELRALIEALRTYERLEKVSPKR